MDIRDEPERPRTPPSAADRPATLLLPVRGGWGRRGATHIRLAKADRETLAGALRAAWRLRLEKNAASKRNQRRG